MRDGGMVIVGAGETGATASAALRDQGWDGAITLIGEEVHPPYERPPLSKDLITEAELQPPRLVHEPDRLDELGIEHLAGRCVVEIDRSGHRVILDDGEAIGYERLLLATGAEARRLPLTGTGADTVLYLRRHEDAVAIRDALRPGTRAVIVGGGFIGLELAASAASRGAHVTLLEAAPRILTRGVPAELAVILAARHAQAGVELRTDVRIDSVDADAVVLADGERIACDVVIAGVGAVPRTDLAVACGLAIDNGIQVDATLATGDPAIFAAGDCCSFIHPLFDGRRIRLEAWRNTHDQGTLVAMNMLDAAEPVSVPPWFWSDQYELTLQIAGLADAGADTVVRDPGDGALLLFHLAADGRLVGASGLGPIGKIAKEIRIAEMLIQRRAAPNPTDLASPAFRLRDLLRT